MTSYLSLLEPSRLCAICDMALKSHILCVNQSHHKSGLDLEKASDLGCYICGTIRHSNTWLRRSEECRSSSFEYVLNLHNAGSIDTLEGLIIGKASTGCCWAFQLWKDPGMLPIHAHQTLLTNTIRPYFFCYVLQALCLAPRFRLHPTCQKLA